MSTINTFIDSIVNSIAEHFSSLSDPSKLVTCVSLPGYLETTELTNIHANTPGVFVAPVGSGEVILVETGESDVTMQMVAYLLVVDNDSIAREDNAQELMTQLLGYISRSGQRWGLANAHPTRAVESADVHGLTNDFQPHVKDWRMGTAILARAADLYGSTNPISNLALWAITWEQILRIGTNDYEDTGEITPHAPQMPSDSGDGFVVVTSVAGGLDFTNSETDGGEIAGTLTITQAEDETGLTHYNLYWASGPSNKLDGQERIASLEKTGADLDYSFAENTAIPDGATHLLVYTQDNGIEAPSGVSVVI